MQHLSEVIKRAAQILTPESWLQGRMMDNDIDKARRFCVLGAIARAAWLIDKEKWNVNYNQIVEKFRAEGIQVAEFNDAPGRKFWEVKEFLNQCLILFKSEVS